jgi:hypothetical protein
VISTNKQGTIFKVMERLIATLFIVLVIGISCHNFCIDENMTEVCNLLF